MPKRRKQPSVKTPAKAARKLPPAARPTVTVEDELLQMDAAIALLKTTRPTFYRWLRSGKLKGRKVGRQWRFHRSEIDRFLAGQPPRIDLPSSIDPLVDALGKRLREVGAEPAARNGAPPTEHAVRLMLALARHMRATDLHLAPHVLPGRQAVLGVLRLRIDGVLHPVAEIDIRLWPALVEQWKVLAGCDLHEHKRPQNGRLMTEVDGRSLDVLVFCVATHLGEAVSARLLSHEDVVLGLDKMELAPGDLVRIRRFLDAPTGMMVVTGPDCCGKTMLLYSCLLEINGERCKIMTAEDPVEYVLPWTVQIPLDRQLGITFASAVRSMLRSDVDVLMAGEIRIPEDLQMLQTAALTGHLALTTLHAEDTASALLRMVDLGGDAFAVADSTKLVVALRLLRKLCPDCSAPKEPPTAELERALRLARTGGVGPDALPRQFRAPVGCPRCSRTGYRGRIPMAETLDVTPEIGCALRRGASTEELRAIAVGQGMTTLAADGIRRAAAGLTTLDEVLRMLPQSQRA